MKITWVTGLRKEIRSGRLAWGQAVGLRSLLPLRPWRQNEEMIWEVQNGCWSDPQAESQAGRGKLRQKVRNDSCLSRSNKYRLMGTNFLLMYMITDLVASVVSDIYSNRRFDASVLTSGVFLLAYKINIIYRVLFLSLGLFMKVFFTLLAEKQDYELNKENEYKVEL